jgi:hypothetical protein
MVNANTAVVSFWRASGPVKVTVGTEVSASKSKVVS